MDQAGSFIMCVIKKKKREKGAFGSVARCNVEEQTAGGPGDSSEAAESLKQGEALQKTPGEQRTTHSQPDPVAHHHPCSHAGLRRR